MKFVGAIIVYLLMAVVLAWGILDLMHGRFWVLVGGVAGYTLLLSAIGCRLPKSHH